MLHLLACLTVEAGVMTLDQKLTVQPADPVQKILEIAKVTKSEVRDLKWDLVDQPDGQPVDCSRLPQRLN